VQVLKPRWCWTPQGVRGGLCLELDGDRIAGVVDAGLHPEVPELGPTLAMPALVNAHSHAFQRAFRGHVQWTKVGTDDFWSWRDRMYTVANQLDPDGVEAVSALAFLEMAESGIGHVGEFHYLHHAPDGAPYADPDELARRVLAAADLVGIRITLLRVAYLRASSTAPLRADQRRFGDAGPDAVLGAVARLGAGAGPLVRVGLAPHSVRAVPLAALRELASFDGVVHAHVSEQVAENEQCVAEYGLSPLALFERSGLLHERFVAVHLTWPMAGDVERLVSARAGLCVCPSTELDLGDGFLPLPARERARLCLGSDSQATIDLWSEARALELHGRGLAGRRNVLSPPGETDGLARRLLTAATSEGERALGGVGAGLVAGAPADVVVLDLDRPAADGVPPLEAAAFVAAPEWVRELWVAGRRIVSEGRHSQREFIRRRALPHLG
jgi:formimidoylglutamate deiminase